MDRLADQFFRYYVLPPNDSIAPCTSIQCTYCLLNSKGNFTRFLPVLLQRIKLMVKAVSTASLIFASSHLNKL